MLKKGAYSTIVIVGDSEREAELKQLKMSIYALLGKLSLEVGVHVDVRKSWSQEEVGAAVSKAVEKGEPIYGVLCCPAYDGKEPPEGDILALEESQVAAPWATTVGFLHNVAKSAMPHLRSHNHAQRDSPGTFAVTGPTERSSTSEVYWSACDAFMNLLGKSNAAKSMIVDYAENVLIAGPEPERANGEEHVPAPQQATAPESDFDDLATAEASPTKLWAMWDELGAAD